MNVFEPNHSQQLLFALLKLALWNKAPDKALFEKADETIWGEVYRLSADQGIKAVIFDGIMLLNRELQPPRSLKLKWAINVEAIERRYEQSLMAINGMADIFTKNGISMLVLKGVSLAQYYPVPSHREFADIDIYLFGKQEEGDRLLLQSGAAKKIYQSGKHSGLQFNGIIVENHNYFLTEKKFHNAAALEKHLAQTLSDNPLLSNPLICNAVLPPPDFNVLFIACHALGDFITKRLILRFLCDWALFLKANKDVIDFDSYRRLITESGFKKFADAFTALAVNQLGLDSDFALPFDSNPALENRIMQESFNPLFSSITGKQSLLKMIQFKFNVIKSGRWKYKELLYPEQFYKIAWRSFLFYITHPASIGKN